MKKVHITGSILAVALMITSGCGGGGQTAGELITVDVTKSYPARELILQDFMDVEYVPLETSNDYLCQGIVKAVGREVMIVTNRVDDGDIFVFDRTGKGLRRFNRKGQGAGEYLNIGEVVLDEDAGEMFVNDYQGRRLLVYDLYGVYKRSLNRQDGISYYSLTDFDSESLICNGASANVNMVNGAFVFDTQPSDSVFVVISKQDGRIVRGVDIDYAERKPTTVIQMITTGGVRVFTMNYPSIKPVRDGWILNEPSADTIFRLSPDGSLTPLMARTPSIQSMQPEVFLFPDVRTDRYYLMKTEKKDNATTSAQQWDGFPKTHLMCDLQDNSIYECTVLNGDYSVEKPIDMFTDDSSISAHTGVVFQQRIEAIDLVEASEKGQLTGRLKEIADGLDEESNPVIMLVKHRQ